MTTYNGWTNYATWRINLEMLEGLDVSEWADNPSDLSNQLKEYVEEWLDETTPDGLGKDYALAFISDVNWYEIAEHLISEAS